jgi:hypothetical protein
MRLLVFFGVYEAEASFAHVCLDQILDILRDHTVHLVIQDDASPSRLGDRLAAGVRARLGDRVRVVRIERSLGFHGFYERRLSMLDQATQWGETFDYVVQLDPDLHFCSRKLAEVLQSPRLPELGIVGPAVQMRKRDYLLFLADFLPAGFRRRHKGELLEHPWELRRVRRVWWHDIGWQALRGGFRGRIVTGALQVLSWKSVLAMRDRGWLSRRRRPVGLIYQDDVLIASFLAALGHPLRDLQEVVPTWKAEMFLAATTTAEEIRRRGFDLIHALKNDAWAHALREQLPLPPVRRDAEEGGVFRPRPNGA